MSITEQRYESLITDMLEGRTPALREFREHLDGAGLSSVLALYQSTGGEDRAAIIHAMGNIIAHGDAAPGILAQVINLATNLDISQVEPSVEQLRAQKIAHEQPVRDAIVNFLAYRELQRRFAHNAIAL